MAAVGGDVLEITYNHPTLGSGTWMPKAGEDFTINLGGITGSDDENNVSGGGSNIKILSRRRWSMEGSIEWDANIANELEQAANLAAHPVDAEWTITLINGTVWAGQGSVVGDVQGSTNSATIGLKIAGGGKMKKIVG